MLLVFNNAWKLLAKCPKVTPDILIYYNDKLKYKTGTVDVLMSFTVLHKIMRVWNSSCLERNLSIIIPKFHSYPWDGFRKTFSGWSCQFEMTAPQCHGYSSTNCEEYLLDWVSSNTVLASGARDSKTISCNIGQGCFFFLYNWKTWSVCMFLTYGKLSINQKRNL